MVFLKPFTALANVVGRVLFESHREASASASCIIRFAIPCRAPWVVSSSCLMLSIVRAASLYRLRRSLQVLMAVAKLKTSPTTAAAEETMSIFRAEAS